MQEKTINEKELNEVILEYIMGRQNDKYNQSIRDKESNEET
jgi:hypothetical protein